MDLREKILINTIITDAIEAFEIGKQKPDTYHVLSIKNSNGNMLSKIDHSLYSKNNLVLRFDDKTPDSYMIKRYKLCTTQDCEHALKFLSDNSLPLIVHCNAGISRSTALFLGYLLKHFSYKEAVDLLFDIRDCASPNIYILKLMCYIIGNSDYKLIIEYIDYKKSHFKKNMRMKLAKKFLDYHKQQK